MTEESAANPEFWTEKGRVNVNAIRLRFGAARAKAYDLASLARNIRKGDT